MENDTKHSLTSDEAKFCWSTLKSSIHLSKKKFKYIGVRGYMFRHTTIYPTLHFFCSNTAPKQGKPNICYFAVLMAQGRASETGDKFKNSNIMYQILAATNWALKTTNH